MYVSNNYRLLIIHFYLTNVICLNRVLYFTENNDNPQIIVTGLDKVIYIYIYTIAIPIEFV